MIRERSLKIILLFFMLMHCLYTHVPVLKAGAQLKASKWNKTSTQSITCNRHNIGRTRSGLAQILQTKEAWCSSNPAPYLYTNNDLDVSENAKLWQVTSLPNELHKNSLFLKTDHVCTKLMWCLHSVSALRRYHPLQFRPMKKMPTLVKFCFLKYKSNKGTFTMILLVIEYWTNDFLHKKKMMSKQRKEVKEDMVANGWTKNSHACCLNSDCEFNCHLPPQGW